MYRLVRDSFYGRLAYHLSSHKLFAHKEESNDYIIPERYLQEYKENSNSGVNTQNIDKEVIEANDSSSSSLDTVADNAANQIILVDWDGDDDPENPYNWSLPKKLVVVFQVCLLTTCVYMASSVYTPGVDEIREKFGVGQTLALFPLTFFVLGYGIGAMIFSPMSENAVFGRTTLYIFTLFIFFVLQFPTAVVKNLAGMTVLRFIAGLFSSPCLSIGGASMGDIFGLPYLPVAIATWSISAVCGPTLGPLFGAILVVKRDVMWTFWFCSMTSGILLIVLGFFLPETYSKTLLYRKAKRLRAKTGNPNIKSQGELDNESMEFRELMVDTFYRPFEIIFLEPVVLLIDLHIALVYSILYLFFEAFPIVFIGVFNFTPIEMGVAYVGFMLGVIITAIFYVWYISYKITKPLLRDEEVPPEVFIPIMIVGSCIMPIGLFIFGWTAQADLHWMGPIMGVFVFGSGGFLIFQTGFNYLANSFYSYLASVFAGNNLFRSSIAGCFPLFAHALFTNVSIERYPVAWGSTILGVIGVIMVLIPILFYLNGPKLRAKSKYSGA